MSQVVEDGQGFLSVAVASLAEDPWPPEAFHRADYHRLRVCPYRVVYVIDGDLITIERLDRRTDD